MLVRFVQAAARWRRRGAEPPGSATGRRRTLDELAGERAEARGSTVIVKLVEPVPLLPALSLALRVIVVGPSGSA